MDEQLRATKRWLQTQFKTSGVTLDPKSLEKLVQAVQDVPDPQEFVHSLIDEIETGELAGASARQAAAAERRAFAQAAMSGPVRYLLLCQSRHACLQPARAPASAVTDERRVTPALLEQVLSALEGRSQAPDAVQVVDAFRVPHVVYDPVRKLFHRSAVQPKLQADAKARPGRTATALLLRRCHLCCSALAHLAHLPTSVCPPAAPPLPLPCRARCSCM